MKIKISKFMAFDFSFAAFFFSSRSFLVGIRIFRRFCIVCLAVNPAEKGSVCSLFTLFSSTADVAVVVVINCLISLPYYI